MVEGSTCYERCLFAQHMSHSCRNQIEMWEEIDIMRRLRQILNRSASDKPVRRAGFFAQAGFFARHPNISRLFETFESETQAAKKTLETEFWRFYALPNVKRPRSLWCWSFVMADSTTASLRATLTPCAGRETEPRRVGVGRCVCFTAVRSPRLLRQLVLAVPPSAC